MNSILVWLLSHYPQIAFMLVIAVPVAYIAWRASGIYHRLKKVEKESESIAPLKNEVTVLKYDVEMLKADVAILKVDVAVLKKDVAILKIAVAILKQDVAILKQDVIILKQDVAMLKQDVIILKQDVAMLKQDVIILKQDVAMLKQDVIILKQDVAMLKQDVADLKSDVRNILIAINRICVHLGISDLSPDRPLLKGNSPLQLTAAANILLEEAGARQIIDDNLDLLLKHMDESRGPAGFGSPLDVQDEAYLLFFKLIDSDVFIPVRDYIYENPIFDSAEVSVRLTLPKISELMAVYLRNKYLEARPDFRENRR